MFGPATDGTASTNRGILFLNFRRAATGDEGPEVVLKRSQWYQVCVGEEAGKEGTNFREGGRAAHVEEENSGGSGLGRGDGGGGSEMTVVLPYSAAEFG